MTKFKLNKEKLEELEKKCICRSCQSFEDCKEKIAYCLLGKSKCISEEKGCICGSCNVHAELGFDKGYYCLTGRSKS